MWPKIYSEGKTALKRAALNLLPESLLTPIRKLHYASVLKSLTEDYDRDFKVMKHLINRGDHVVDVGAHVGIYTKYLCGLVGDGGRVYSIEPIPVTFDILRSNVKRLGLKNVELINCAISSADGCVMMKVPSWKFGKNYYDAKIVSERAGDSSDLVKVQSKTLDSIFYESPFGISFIKCDAEAHEFECVKGAINIIRKTKPAWLIEVSLLSKATYQELLAILQQEGYKDSWFDGVRLKPWHGEETINVFFLTKSHMQSLKGTGLINHSGPVVTACM